MHSLAAGEGSPGCLEPSYPYSRGTGGGIRGRLLRRPDAWNTALCGQEVAALGHLSGQASLGSSKQETVPRPEALDVHKALPKPNIRNIAKLVLGCQGSTS